MGHTRTEGAERLRAWRRTAGPNGDRLTQGELADRLDVTQGTISHIEDVAQPGLDVAVRIERLTGIEPAAWTRRSKR